MINKNVLRLTKTINISDTTKKVAVYYGIAYVVATKLITKENSNVNDARIKLVSILDPIVEMAIVDYDLLKNICLEEIANRAKIMEGSLESLSNASTLCDLYYATDSKSNDTVKILNDNIPLIRQVGTAFNIWYEQTYLLGE